jgi:hypothetical protein
MPRTGAATATLQVNGVNLSLRTGFAEQAGQMKILVLSIVVAATAIAMTLTAPAGLG